MSNNDKQADAGRRNFMGSALSAAAGLTAATSVASSAAVAQVPGPMASDMLDRYVPTPKEGRKPQLFRAELTISDCEVEGKIPSDLRGAFYRTGPDAQYPLAPGNIPFDGEGHVSQFEFTGGRVNFQSRFVRNERYVAQEKAGKLLFPMYRNPYLNDPAAKGLSRGTHNTHIIHHNGVLLALKEDSPPAVPLLTVARYLLYEPLAQTDEEALPSSLSKAAWKADEPEMISLTWALASVMDGLPAEARPANRAADTAAATIEMDFIILRLQYFIN